MVPFCAGVCTHSQSEQCEALCVGSSHHYWSGREGVVIRTTTTTPSCPDHYCSSYKAVLLHTPPPYGGELQLFLWRLLHHTALASLFATFGLAHLQEALPSPSVLTPCDYRMLQSQVK